MSECPKADAVVHSRTDREIIRFTLKWTIGKVRSLRKQKTRMCSDGITLKELGMGSTYQGRFCICLCPALVDNDERASDGSAQILFLVFLKLCKEQSGLSTGGKNVDTEITASMFTGNAMDTILDTMTLEWTFCLGPLPQRVIRACSVGHRSLFGTHDDPGLLKDDCITIVMDVLLYKEPTVSRMPTAHIMSATERCSRFAQRQANRFSSDQTADFVLQSSDGREFNVSRFLLMAHSPVFAAMLTHDTKEKQTSRCELTDIDGESVVVLLEYVYGCEIGKISETNAEKILITADKYEIGDLRAVCEGMLANSVTADNALHCLILSSQRDLNTLKEAALKVIPKNLGAVLHSHGMEEAMQSDPELIRTVMQHCPKRMRVIDESE